MSSTNPGPAITTGSTTTGGASPVAVGSAATSLVGFYGATPVVQASYIATVTASTTLSQMVVQLNAVIAALSALGIAAAS